MKYVSSYLVPSFKERFKLFDQNIEMSGDERPSRLR